MTIDEDRFLAFLNTHRFAGPGDVLADPRTAAAWLDPEDPPDLSTDDLARLVDTRERLRTILLHHGGHVPLADLTRNAAELNANLAPGTLRGWFRGDGVAVVSPPADAVEGSGRVGAFLASLLAFAVDASATGRWARLKACGNPECTAAFRDSSRNRSSAWCSSRCSNRMNVRAYRQRHHPPAGSTS